MWRPRHSWWTASSKDKTAYTGYRLSNFGNVLQCWHAVVLCGRVSILKYKDLYIRNNNNFCSYYLTSTELIHYIVGRDSSVGIATRCGLDGPGIESRWGTRFSAPVPTGPGAHPASCTMGTGSFPGVKQSGHGVDHPFHLGPLWAFMACSWVNFYLIILYYIILYHIILYYIILHYIISYHII